MSRASGACPSSFLEAAPGAALSWLDDSRWAEAAVTPRGPGQRPRRGGLRTDTFRPSSSAQPLNRCFASDSLGDEGGVLAYPSKSDDFEQRARRPRAGRATPPGWNRIERSPFFVGGPLRRSAPPHAPSAAVRGNRTTLPIALSEAPSITPPERTPCSFAAASSSQVGVVDYPTARRAASLSRSSDHARIKTSLGCCRRGGCRWRRRSTTRPCRCWRS